MRRSIQPIIPMIGLIENTAGTPVESGHLVRLIESIFKQNGILQETLRLDYRPQQATMALHIAQSLETDTPLLFEAGTGVGKSLAYLIPGLIHAIESERPMVISSHTITLQEQIRSKELQLCRQLFNAAPQLKHYAKFKTALMIGRANYCCTTRLSNALKDIQSPGQTELFGDTAKAEIIRLTQWSSSSKNGILQELSPLPMPDVWESINADSSTCSKKNCDPEVCFYQRARRQLLKSNCIIVNHSLLFSLIHAGMPPEGNTRGILMPDDFVVLDEAHRIPSIATDHFGIHISSYAVDRLLKRIYNPRTRRGILGKIGQHWDRQAVENALTAAQEFFSHLSDTFLSRRSIQRVREANFCENILSGPLREVAERLHAIIQKSDNDRLHDELKDYRRRVLDHRDTIKDFVNLVEDDHVYWLERGGKKGQIIILNSAPLDVAPYLREALFSRKTAAVLTSATLSNGTDMASFQQKVGGEHVEAQIENSPFNYKDNCRVYIANDAPSPSPGQGRLDLDYLADMICWFSSKIDGGTLALFNSHFDLRQVYQRCEAFFRKINRPLLCQGQDIGRNELVHQFAQSGNAVLLGTDSFWTGIDVPGPALSQVIITRLPFENPTHPISEARSEYIREQGGNPFVEMTVHEALIKFRQGIGRLIRRYEDSGNIVILDSRILTKSYGHRFLNALPVKTFTRFNAKNREQLFQ